MGRFEVLTSWAGIAIGFTIVAALRPTAHHLEKAKEKRFVPPPTHAELFTFGYNESISDALWLRLLQDFDVCDIESMRKTDPAAAPAKPATIDDKLNYDPAWLHADRERPPSLCKEGWVFKMLTAITEITPRWRLPHYSGSVMLSVAVDDRVGATEMFEKALSRFPADYNILYAAAYHFMWEMKDNKRAADLLIKAAERGGPSWFYSLAGKLYSESGQAALAKTILVDALKNNDLSPENQKRIRKRLADVEAVLAKSPPNQ